MEAPAQQATAIEATLPVFAAAELVTMTPESAPVTETETERALETAPASTPEPEQLPAPKPEPEPEPEPERVADSEPAQKSTTTLLASGALVAALLVGGAYWFVFKDKATESDLVATSPAPVVQVAPSPEPQTASSAVPTEAPAPVPAAVPLTPPADQPKAEIPPVKLAVVKKKPAEKKTPESLPVAPLSSVVVEAPLVKVDIPPPPKPIARTVDETLNARAAAECASGFSGLFCREKIRFSVCDGKWSEIPPPGQTACKGTGTN